MGSSGSTTMGALSLFTPLADEEREFDKDRSLSYEVRSGKKQALQVSQLEAQQPPETSPQQALILAALAGQARLKEALVRQMAPVIQVRVARALMRHRKEALGRDLRPFLEDMVQEVFARLFAKDGKILRAWDPERGLSFQNFVGFVTEREVHWQMRTGKRNPWTEDPTMDDTLDALSPGPPPQEASLESRDLLRRLVIRMKEQLSPQGFHYFQLLYVKQIPVKTVAEMTGASEDALYAWRSRLSKLLRKLNAELNS